MADFQLLVNMVFLDFSKIYNLVNLVTFFCVLTAKRKMGCTIAHWKGAFNRFRLIS